MTLKLCHGTKDKHKSSVHGVEVIDSQGCVTAARKIGTWHTRVETESEAFEEAWRREGVGQPALHHKEELLKVIGHRW